MESKKKWIQVEVIFISPSVQMVIEVNLLNGSTVKDAIVSSGILALCSEIDLSRQSVGICSRRCQLGDFLQNWDQVEIYRPLVCDPKEARRRRAQNIKS